VSDPALTLSFHDTGRELHGTVRTGMTLLFRAGQPVTVPSPATFERVGAGWRAQVAERVDLTFEPTVQAVDLGGANAAIGRVHGSVDKQPVDCIGVVTETIEPPAWGKLDALRSLSAVFDGESAVLALALRPRGARGHGDERVTGWLVSDGVAKSLEETRISTVYDGDGRQRKAGLELWLPAEDFPRRASGSARAGASLTLEGLRVHAAVFEWHMEGRTGTGSYDVVVREEEPAAA
jgi:hypothetical protein